MKINIIKHRQGNILAASILLDDFDEHILMHVKTTLKDFCIMYYLCFLLQCYLCYYDIYNGYFGNLNTLEHACGGTAISHVSTCYGGISNK